MNQLIEFDPMQMIGLGVAAALLVGLIFWWIYKLAHPSLEKQVEKTIKENSEDYAKDIVVSDGLYGYHFIDYLVLLPGRIVVLGLHSFEGYIFGADKIEEWAQVLNNRSYKFENPLLKNSHYVQSVQELTRNTEVIGRVLFTGNCSFPKGIPEGVIELGQLPSMLDELKRDTDSEATKVLWDELLAACRQQKNKYLNDK
ncbi:MAG: NERD domain-containing protein [Gammaproteobacteria bacterium]|nr:NERD domain-containing protein [Gammaproteobacteria bacterium]MDH5802398.1 NERD domain-containing protein [Gammaproteobacteria bacterium]